jgi:hypothetical protein
MKYFLGFLLLFSGIVFLAAGYLLASSHSQNIVKPIVYENIVLGPSPSLSPSTPLFFSAEITSSSEQKALVALASGSGILKEILPSWYLIHSDGVIRPIPSNLKAEIMQLSFKSGIKIIPTIQVQWQSTKEHFLLTNERKLQVAGKILDLVENKQYDGINISIDNVPPDIQAEITALLEKVSEELSTKNKKCYISVNEKRYDSKKHVTMIIPFSENLPQRIKEGKRNNIINFSFQFLGTEDPTIWDIVKTVE